MLSRFSDLAIFPSNDSVTRPPSSLHGVPRDGSPASSVLLRCYDALSPSRRASFPSLGGTAAAPADSLPQMRTTSAVGLDDWSPGAQPGFHRGDLRVLPGSWATLLWTCPGLIPRGTSDAKPSGARDIAFRSPQDVGSPMQSLEADYHGLHTRCLRFVARITPTTTQDSLPVGG